MPPPTNTLTWHQETWGAEEASVLTTSEKGWARFFYYSCSISKGWHGQRAVFYKRLSSVLANKWNQTYGSTMSWLCCRLTFLCLDLRYNALILWVPDPDVYTHKARQTWFVVSHQRPLLLQTPRFNFHYCLLPRARPLLIQLIIMWCHVRQASWLLLMAI